MKMGVGQGKGHQVTLCGEGDFDVSHLKHHVLTFKPIDGFRRKSRHPRRRLCDEVLQSGIVKRGCLGGRTRDADRTALQRAPGMVSDRADLKAQGRHVGDQACIDHFLRIDPLFGAIGKALVQYASDCAQDLLK